MASCLPLSERYVLLIDFVPVDEGVPQWLVVLRVYHEVAVVLNFYSVGIIYAYHPYYRAAVVQRKTSVTNFQNRTRIPMGTGVPKQVIVDSFVFGDSEDREVAVPLHNGFAFTIWRH